MYPLFCVQVTISFWLHEASTEASGRCIPSAFSTIDTTTTTALLLILTSMWD